MRSAIRAPLWSSMGEYHRCEWAFTSAAMIELSIDVVCRSAVVMSSSSVAWLGSVVFRGGI